LEAVRAAKIYNLSIRQAAEFNMTLHYVVIAKNLEYVNTINFETCDNQPRVWDCHIFTVLFKIK